MAIELNASADYGHTGQYVARLIGRDSKFTFRREFIGTKGGKRGDFSSATVDDPGAYECRDVTRKGKLDRYYLVAELDGELHRVRSDKEDCMAICKALDAGRTFGEFVRLSRAAPPTEALEHGTPGAVVYEILSAAAAGKAQAAVTITSAVDAIVAALSGLDGKAQKEALKAAKERLAQQTTADIDRDDREYHKWKDAQTKAARQA